MRALRVDGPGAHAIVEVPDPQPGPNEAVVRILFTALCGTDFALLRAALHDAEYPIIPGHEWCGVVESAPEVHTALVGTVVVGHNFLPCGDCGFCRAGRENLCVSLEEIGFTRPGSCAELCAVPVANLRPLPNGLDPAAACLVEPLCVALHAVERAPDLDGRAVCVLGAGAVGLLVAQLCANAGASVTVVDPRSDRRTLARQFPVTAALDPSVLFERSGPRPTVVFDATGNPETFATALDLVEPAGTVVLVGYSGDARASFAPATVMLKELDIRGALSGYGMLDRALALLGRGAVDLTPLVAGTVPLEHYEKAADLLDSSTGVRAVLHTGADR